MNDNQITSEHQLRAILLQQAQRILEQKVQVDMAKSKGQTGTAPTTEAIILEAEKLFNFVQRKEIKTHKGEK